MKQKDRLDVEKYSVKGYVKNVVVADEFNAERFKNIYIITPDIINYGIDHAFFAWGNGEAAITRFSLQNSFVLLQVGAITPFKNQIESIKAIESLKDEIPRIKLLLVGLQEGNYVEMLHQYIRANGLEPYVTFTGHLSHSEIRDLYHACDIALYPIKSQGGWLSPFEALSASLPIIVSSRMTAADIIARGELGIVTDNFVDAVKAIYNNPEKYANSQIDS